MKIVWVCFLLVILLAVVQGKRGGGGGKGRSSNRGSSSRGSRGSKLRKAAIVGAGVYVGYKVGDTMIHICSYRFTSLSICIIFPTADQGYWKVSVLEP